MGSEAAGQLPGEAGVVQHRHRREIQRQTAIVEIGAAHRRNPLVHHQQLGVRHGWAVLVNRDPGTDQFVVIATRGGAAQAGVAPLGHQHSHLHAAQGGGDQGGDQRLVGDEVRRGQLLKPVGRELGQPRALAATQSDVATVWPILEPVHHVSQARRGFG